MEKKEITQQEAKTKIQFYADAKCKKCYGRGYVSITMQGLPILCKCTKKNFNKTI